MKNRTIIGIICIVLAMATMLIISPLINNATNGRITVVQVNKEIAKGVQITSADITKVEIGRYGISSKVLTDPDAIVGKYAKADLYPNTNLTEDMFTTDANNIDAVLESLNENNIAISISVPSFASAVSAKLRKGDIVSVAVTTEDITTIPKALTYVRVITTTNSEGQDLDSLPPSSEGNASLPASVTLLVSPLQAKLLAGYETNATVHLALVHRGTAESAQRFIDMQNHLLNEIEAEQNPDGGQGNGDISIASQNGGELQ